MATKYDHKTSNAELVSDLSSQIAGTTVLVTGVSVGGLGYQFLKEIMVADPAVFILAGRTPSKFQGTVDEIAAAKPNIKVKTLQLDLASFKSVRKAAETVNGWTDIPHIDVQVNNAGIMCPPHTVTKDGNEAQFQSNHLGHFLFTNLIMEKVLASKSPRIVTVTSNGHRFGGVRWTDPNFSGGKHYDSFKAYAQSKTANNLFALGAANRLAKRGLTSVSVHPGVVMGTNLAGNSYTTPDQFLKDMLAAEDVYGTNFANGFFPEESEYKDEKNSVATYIFAAYSPELASEELNGKFFLNARLADPWKGEVYSWTTSDVDAERLWKLSEKMVGEEFNY